MFLRQAMLIPKLKGYKVSSISNKKKKKNWKIELMIYKVLNQ